MRVLAMAAYPQLWTVTCRTFLLIPTMAGQYTTASRRVCATRIHTEICSEGLSDNDQRHWMATCRYPPS
jgi:hypothetical protein